MAEEIRMALSVCMATMCLLVHSVQLPLQLCLAHSWVIYEVQFEKVGSLTWGVWWKYLCCTMTHPFSGILLHILALVRKRPKSGDVAQSIKNLMHKHEGLSFSPQNSLKRDRHGGDDWYLSAGEADMGRYPLAPWLANLNWSVSLRPIGERISKTREMANEEWQMAPKVDLQPPCAQAPPPTSPPHTCRYSFQNTMAYSLVKQIPSISAQDFCNTTS